jgi:hypothetical protein
MDGEQMLGVGVAGDHLGAGEPFLGEPVDRVAAASAAADDLDVRLQRREDRLELRVVPGRGGRRVGRTPGVSG